MPLKLQFIQWLYWLNLNMGGSHWACDRVTTWMLGQHFPYVWLVHTAFCTPEYKTVYITECQPAICSLQGWATCHIIECYTLFYSHEHTQVFGNKNITEYYADTKFIDQFYAAQLQTTDCHSLQISWVHTQFCTSVHISFNADILSFLNEMNNNKILQYFLLKNNQYCFIR